MITRSPDGSRTQKELVMSANQLTVTTRNRTGKGAARQLRAKGLVPGVLYGATKDGPVAPVSIVVDVKALKAALDPERKQNTVIDLTVDGESPRRVSALLREYQLDVIRREVSHVDLLAIDPDKEITTEVPLELVGKPAGAINGGQLHTVMRALDVRCKPADIPLRIQVDVSPLEIGDVIHVSDLTMPAGVVAVTGLGQAIVSCVPPEAEAAAPEAAAAVPGAEAAPAADAKGAAPAAGKDAKAAPAAAAKPAEKKK